jgi:hypothetical protein
VRTDGRLTGAVQLQLEVVVKAERVDVQVVAKLFTVF